MHLVLLLLYGSVLVFLCSYGVHRALLSLQCVWHKKRLERAMTANALPAELPRVTVQLPLYNEATVARRLIEAAGALDYPADKLELQILDDSNDETVAIARAAVKKLREAGIDAVYVRRSNRLGYKAGALDHGLSLAKGELIAVFDADFVPQPSFLKEVVGHFNDPRIGMVQTRWGHMNRAQSLLTSIQALMLDGHHLVENRARFATGCMFNFSGTGGIWRRAAIKSAGGWQHDTLTEDLDLSYRAQLVGYRFIYRADVVTPAELPEDMSAFRAQQYRWAKGTVQTARKLMERVWDAPLTVHQRVEATFHLLPHVAYPMMVLLTLLLLPALIFMPATDMRMLLIIDLPLCIGTTGSLAAFYGMAERAAGRSPWNAIVRLPALIALGAGLAPHLSAAVFDGITSMSGEFVRTPKRGEARGRYRQVAKLPFAEMALALVSAASVVAAIETQHYIAAPFAALFMCGYAYVATLVIQEQFVQRSSIVPASEAVESDSGMASAA